MRGDCQILFFKSLIYLFKQEFVFTVEHPDAGCPITIIIFVSQHLDLFDCGSLWDLEHLLTPVHFQVGRGVGDGCEGRVHVAVGEQDVGDATLFVGD